jgi:alcohol dehydrogenase class IV
MFEQAVTNTKVIKSEYLLAEALEKLIFYCGGEHACPCIIIDNNPLLPRDKMLGGLRSIRPFELQNRVFPDPKVDDIMAMVEELKGKPIDVIVGIGGGSTMDAAKGVAAVLSNGGDLNDYLGAEATRKIGKRDIKLVLIPTTAGTGSEVTKVGVFTARSGRKYTLGHPLLQPDIAVLVTEYVQELPSALTASTAFDALSHALETLWNRNATPLSDKVAVESAVHLLKWMETAYESSLTGATEGRAEMLEGACMAGTAFNMTGTAAVHALSYIFSEEWHVPHGVACAFMLEDVFRLNAADAKVRRQLAKVGEALFGKSDEEKLIVLLLERIVALKKKFGLPSMFEDLHIELDVNRIGELFDKTLNDPKMKNNVVSINSEIIFGLIAGK